jgi:hypothetical protein
MAKLATEPKDYLKVKKDSKTLILISKKKFESFNENILYLGKNGVKSEQIKAMSDRNTMMLCYRRMGAEIQ